MGKTRELTSNQKEIVTARLHPKRKRSSKSRHNMSGGGDNLDKGGDSEDERLNKIYGLK